MGHALDMTMFEHRTMQFTFSIAALVISAYFILFTWYTATGVGRRSRYRELPGRTSEARFEYQYMLLTTTDSAAGYTGTTAKNRDVTSETGLPPPQKDYAPSLASSDGFEPFPKPKGIIIFTGKRSGSSFVGEIFSHHPKIHYVYEPLRILSHLFQVNEELTGQRLSQAHFTKLAISNIFEKLECHLHYSVEQRSGLLETTVRPCRERSDGTTNIHCLELRQLEDATFIARINRTEKLCRERDVVAVKLIRVQDIADLKPLSNWMDLRVIHLVRDPRPTEVSRVKTRPNYDLIRRKGTDARDEVDLCDHLGRNLRYRSNTPHWLGGKYLLVRYEDVVLNNTEKAREMMEFVGYELHESVIRWINKSTKCDGTAQRCEATYGTVRNSTGILDKWRKDTDWGLVESVQKTCAEVMSLLGYVPFDNAQQLRNLSISAMRPQSE